jgi:hypothetical protein
VVSAPDLFAGLVARECVEAQSTQIAYTGPRSESVIAVPARRVARGTAANLGAEFSEFDYSTLVARSRDDDDLAVRVWSRPEIPREHLLRLFAEASEAVKVKLETADRRKGELIRAMIAEASNRLRTEVPESVPPSLRKQRTLGQFEPATGHRHNISLDLY